MNTPPRFSHSRQSSVERGQAGSGSSSGSNLHHPHLTQSPFLSQNPGSGSHSPHHNPLSPYGQALASLAYASPSFSSLRHPGSSSVSQSPSWSPVNPSSLSGAPLAPNHSSTGSSRSLKEPSAERDKAAESNDEDDDDDDDDDEDEDEEEEGNDSPAKSGQKRKRQGSENEGKGRSKSTNQSPAPAQKDASAPTATSTTEQAPAKKPKPTRGAKACTNCRRLKMRCVGAENGPPCNRCSHGNHECIFEESNRGKKGGKNQKAEAMQQSLKKMEQTLATVLRSIRDPGLAAQTGGMVTRSPSPQFGADRVDARVHPGRSDSHGRIDSNSGSFAARGPPPWSRPEASHYVAGRTGSADPAFRDMASPSGNHVNPSAFAHPTSGSLDGNMSSPASTTPHARFLEPFPHRGTRTASNDPPRSSSSSGQGSDRGRSRHHGRGSPRLHSLPDNTLNPLGLLAEASLHNNHRQRRSNGRASSTGSSAKDRDSAASANSPSKGVKVEGEEGDVAAEGDKDGAKRGNERGRGAKSNATRRPEEERVSLGVASETYFKPGPMTILPLRRIIIEREMPPELLTTGIVSSEEVLDLFRIFFHHCSNHMLLLDADWHTPTFICSRSPFLFTCICTVASKFYTRRPDLHRKCLALVKKVAFDVINRGFKSIEIVQGFLLLSMWNQPAERFEEDKTWLFSGLAIRMATDLNLHRKSVASFSGNPYPDDPAVLDREREILNRERTWYICFIVDRSLSAQMGKPYTVREDWIVRNCRNWGSRFSRVWDMGISALVDLHRIHSRQLDFLYSSTTSVSGLNHEIDYSLVLPIFNEQLEEWREFWRWRSLFDMPPGFAQRQSARKDAKTRADAAVRGEKDGDGAAASAKDAGAKGSSQKPTDSAANEGEDEEEEEEIDHNERALYYVVKQAPLRFNYAALVLNSFGLQQSLDHPRESGLDRAQYFAKCLQAAKNIVLVAQNELRDVLRYAPDSQFVTLAYASVFLLKLIRPVFANYADEESVLTLVTDTADLLDEVAVNETHTPALYASFLRALLQSRQDHTVGSKSATTSRVHSRAASPGVTGGPGGSENGAGNLAENAATNGNSGSDPSGTGTLLTDATAAATAAAVSSSGNLESHAANTAHASALDASLDPVFTLAAATDENASTAAAPPSGWDQVGNAATGMEDFWGSLLPPGFAQTTMHELFGGVGNEMINASSPAGQQIVSRFGMGGGSAFDFGHIGNGNGIASASSQAGGTLPSGGLSGHATPHMHGSRSRRTSLSNGMLNNLSFDFGH